jgi:hypothetical protein
MITALIDLMGSFYQAGNLGQMAVIARSMLATIPGDVVALQFLGLALYQLGQVEAAQHLFRSVAEKTGVEPDSLETTMESASVANYREATQPASGLADAWDRIGTLLSKFGFPKAAERAFQAARSAGGRGTVMLTDPLG